jgi:flavin-dependent dehydrogenase
MKLINDYVKINKAMKDPVLSDDPSDSVNATGTWQVSVRRQNDCLVANGYVLVGDSAWMPKPLDAGGIGPAIVAATIIGKDVVTAIEAGDVTERGLWQYNIDFINDYGYKTAGLEVFRRLLQTLTNEQINYGMKHFLSKLDVEAISKGEHPDFGTVEKLGMMIHGALNKKLADSLRFTAQQNKILTEHYYNFPKTPDGFEAWHHTLHKILNDSFARIKN